MRTVQKRHWDIQRRAPAGKCSLCGGEVYPGETYRRVWGHTLCEDCVWAYLAYMGEVRP